MVTHSLDLPAADGAEIAALRQQLFTHERATRHQLAQVLHDHIGQILTVARLRLDSIGDSLQAKGDKVQGPALHEVSAQLGQALTMIRGMLTDLRPVLLDERGLAAALASELGQHGLCNMPVRMTWDVDIEAATCRWPPQVEYAAFMLAREALVNALRHADATEVQVRLSGNAQQMNLTVHDNGSGLPAADEADVSFGLGVLGMRERSLSVGAQFAIHSQPGSGTTVSMRWQSEQA